MSLSAYRINDQAVPPEHFYQVACDPQRSVVVEACAGAGKTWMLVSRILRALLDGVAPSQILAITFTRKAAGEMRERLHEWLREFARADDAERQQQLVMRGMLPAQAIQASAALADLYRQWLEDGRGVEIHTIHGWFSRLVRAAPLDALAELGLPPELNLLEDSSELWPELWGRFLRRMDAQQSATESDDPAVRVRAELDAFVAMVRDVGRFNLESWLQSALSNRLEITLADQAGHLQGSVESVGQWSGEWAGVNDPREALLKPSVNGQFWALAKLLCQAKGAKAQTAGRGIEQALGQSHVAAQYDGLRQALFTDKGPRKQLGEFDELAWAVAWLSDLALAVEQAQAHDLHQRMCLLARALFKEYTGLKALRGQVDMVDLELAASHLLSNSSVAGWIQERLDTQVRQLLMDEFQDTSPLQWQTMKSWLGGYAGAGGGLSGRQSMQVFLVGDPKQSIYRFRRADPRVFEAAKHFVLDGLQGDLLSCDHTRRNAPGVIEVLNRVMDSAVAEGAFTGFRPHTTESNEAAKVSVLPDVPRPSSEPRHQELDMAWRDTLVEPREEPDSSLKQLEAEHVARAIGELIRDQGLQPEDIFVLSRKRATLAWVGLALQAQGVPYVAPEDTKLIDTPEVRDLVALVEALVSPQNDLALAHALRSPVFAWSDDDVMDLAARARAAGGTWWRALMAWGDPGPAVQHAAQSLARWQALARHAPPHDLLEAMLTQGRIRERWVATVPPSMRAQAMVHINALLAQSLDMDGGRDATPYRWIRVLKRLPLALPARVHPGAVQLLTIHGAKGLEARVVFIVDADAQEGRPNNHTVMVDWPESEARPVSCAFIRSEANPPPSLSQAMDHERAAQRREELNALYVALTRAREQLVFSRTQPRTSNKHGSWWQRLIDAKAIGEVDAWVPRSSDAAFFHDIDGPRPSDARLAVLPVLESPCVIPVAFTALPMAEDAALLGQVVHKALEWLTTLAINQRSTARVQQAIQSACLALSAPTLLLERAEPLVAKILGSQELAVWLDPAQLGWAGNEVGLIHNGQTLRIDRLVALDSAAGREWWVLDYKLQHRPQELPSYQAQMRQYVEAVSKLQPGDIVRAAFITGEGRLLELV
ncbi:UvrD-helicase domain-containing protein [Aquabacterium sp.]|uniref:UvrD-helicase domain-containing protein n=1 Tax=Aquabacterium sp. TaxID=1872578 RepID=UPI001985652D|nr:UvrD-helicase domain-containing protein [Aquabacterium sp.]MBC7699266.1 UvrD-helicase domain-containing protein [Aquabacterium sp.]